MDGPHDLGGKQGFGPIETDEPDVAFHHDWEGRMWGLARSAGAPGVTIDWWRRTQVSASVYRCPLCTIQAEA